VFTGIVECVGEVEALRPLGDAARLVVRAPAIAPELRVGDSVAVSGACLTVTEAGRETIAFDAVRETLDRTTLGELAPGGAVNLERALRADGRLDGHIVQGHVDATGRVRELARRGRDVRLVLDCPADLAGQLVPKGSVAIDGVSLTVVNLEPEGFDVALVPHTLQVTTLGRLAAGRRVNLEADVLGKYVKRYVEQILAVRRE
jgi:riboflavin synthase